MENRLFPTCVLDGASINVLAITKQMKNVIKILHICGSQNLVIFLQLLVNIFIALSETIINRIDFSNVVVSNEVRDAFLATISSYDCPDYFR